LFLRPFDRLRASFVPEEFLNGANIIAALQELGGEGVAKDMRGNGFVYSYNARGLANCFLQNAFVEMVTPDFFGFRVSRTSDGREDILPDPFFRGVGIFSG